jgi:hypothetical protein
LGEAPRDIGILGLDHDQIFGKRQEVFFGSRMWVLVQCGTVLRDPNRIGFNPIFALATDLEDLCNREI